MTSALFASALLLAAPAMAQHHHAAAPVPAATPAAATFTLDTPIKDLVANDQAKAVLDADLPGLSTDSNFDKFKDMSLHQMQPLSGGQLTDALMVKTAADLAEIGAPKGGDTAR